MRWITLNGPLLFLLCVAAWGGNIVYALGVPNGAVKDYAPGIVAVALLLFLFMHGARRYGRIGMLKFVAIVFAIGWLFETASVVTGLPFGHYHYTDVMAPVLGHVSVFVLPAYAFMGYASWSLAQLFLGDREPTIGSRAMWLAPPLAAVFMVLWDLSMDPLRATVEGRWIWFEGGAYFGIPLSNFLGWFIVTWCMFQTFALLVARRTGPDADPHVATDSVYWAAVPVIYACFAGEYLINPFTGHGHLLAPAGPTALSAQEIYVRVAIISLATLIPVMVTGCAVARVIGVREPRLAAMRAASLVFQHRDQK